MTTAFSRRALLRGGALAGAGLALDGLYPAWAQHHSAGLPSGPARPSDGTALTGADIRLTVGDTAFRLGDRTGHAVTVNGTIPAPLIRLREGQDVRLHVTNALREDTSVHWHGLLLPFQMDGVPGISFPGIRPGETFTYAFPVRQAGTYWYHSHSGLQEQQGHYGPIIIDPADADTARGHGAYDREHVIVLSDWTFLHPHTLMQRLRGGHGFFNRRRMTLSSPDRARMSRADRDMFARGRMDPTDILDVNGTTYTYLVNGRGPAENWTALFAPGERVRLRIINAASMSIFNVRIPGLPMTVVASDGQDVKPVTVDEFQIGAAETYDVIVTPGEDRAYGFVAEAMDRSGLAPATLAPRPGMSAAVPALRRRPVLTMRDMGMAGHGDHGPGTGQPTNHSMRDGRAAPQVRMGPGVDMIAAMPADRTGEPGLGLEDAGHRVLTYRDLEALRPATRPAPTRTVEIHLTGNMERFMWSFDGVRLSENPEPLRFARDERVRLRLVNDTMMTHPIHLHGHFFEVVNGKGPGQPLKHTVNVQPGGTVDLDLTADAPGDWAFHCHLLLHMHAGMMRVVTVRPLDAPVMEDAR